MFFQGKDPEENIRTCKREWRRLGYKDERTWPHLFPLMLAKLPNKWYKMEEARGETFQWNKLRENFIKDFSFILQNEKLAKIVKQIKAFIESNRNNSLIPNHDRPKISCNNIHSNIIPQSAILQMENENTEGKILSLRNNKTDSNSA